MTIGERVLGGFAAMLLAAAAVLSFMLYQARGRERVVGLTADSLSAALDTSRRVALSREDSGRILGDSMTVVGRRVFQVKQENDALDRALKLERAANADLRATITELEIVAGAMSPVTVDDAGVRHGSFPIDSTPYRGRIDVALPATGRGSIDVRLRIDTARLGLRLGCGRAENGIRTASATLTGPTWIDLALGRVEQDPQVCNPTSPRPSILRRLLSRCGVGPGASMALVSGRLDVRPSVNAGCWVWP